MDLRGNSDDKTTVFSARQNKFNKRRFMDTHTEAATQSLPSAKISFLVGGILLGIGLATFLFAKKQPTAARPVISEGVDDLLKVCQDACYQLDRSERGIAS